MRQSSLSTFYEMSWSAAVLQVCLEFEHVHYVKCADLPPFISLLCSDNLLLDIQSIYVSSTYEIPAGVSGFFH